MLTEHNSGDTFDTITLGDGKIPVRTAFGFVELVGGSRRVAHSPRGFDTPLYRPRSTIIELPPHSAWCYVCGDIRPLHYFRSDCTRPSGHYPMCTECENARRRERYKEKNGGTVRAYRRKTA